MPIRLHQEGDLLQVAFSGPITDADFHAFATEITAVEAGLPVIPARLTDLTAATSMELRYADLAAFTQHRLKQIFPNTFKSAIVAPHPVHYGFARMFQTLNDHPQITIRIFEDRDQALRWLKELGQETVQIS